MNAGATQLALPLDYAPDDVRAHGLRQAHPRPLVGRRRRDRIVSWRTVPPLAWVQPLIEIENAGSAFATVTLDCDDPPAMVAGMASLPPPNWTVWTDSGAHQTWCLRRPVHRYPEARPAPLLFLRRVAEYYTQETAADPGYVHVLTRNPCHPDARTLWGATEPYELGALATVIPFGWRAPRVSQSGIGRNCDLFRDLMQWAGNHANLQTAVIVAATIRNQEFDHPLPLSEVTATARMVEQYRARWAAHGWHSIRWIERQRWRGRLGGRPRLYEPDSEPWTVAGISRATWYRRKRETKANTDKMPELPF